MRASYGEAHAGPTRPQAPAGRRALSSSARGLFECGVRGCFSADDRDDPPCDLVMGTYYRWKLGYLGWKYRLKWGEAPPSSNVA